MVFERNTRLFLRFLTWNELNRPANKIFVVVLFIGLPGLTQTTQHVRRCLPLPLQIYFWLCAPWHWLDKLEDWLINRLIDCQWHNDRLLYWIQFTYVCHDGTFSTMLVKLKEGICDNSGWKMIITMPTSDEVIIIFLSRLKNFTSTSINQTLRIFIKLISIDYYKKLF